MAENKTQKTTQPIDQYLKTIDPKHLKDSKALIKIMAEITKEKAVMWGPSIVGFGTYHYVYDSGREGDFMLCGFSPRKAALTIYIMAGFSGYQELMGRLGKHKTGKSCLYIKSLNDIDIPTLKKLIRESIKAVKEKYSDS